MRSKQNRKKLERTQNARGSRGGPAVRPYKSQRSKVERNPAKLAGEKRAKPDYPEQIGKPTLGTVSK